MVFFSISSASKILIIHLVIIFQIFIGRPVLWGLAYNGEAGVTSVIRLLKKELDLSMALTGKMETEVKIRNLNRYIIDTIINRIFCVIQGCLTIKDIGHSLVTRQEFYSNM